MIYTITEMTEKHYYGKAYVQYAAWFETYRGLMPDEFLDNRKLESCYESTLKHPQDTYVALWTKQWRASYGIHRMQGNIHEKQACLK